MLFPALVSFDAITLDECNACLVEWGHRMGPLAAARDIKAAA